SPRDIEPASQPRRAPLSTASPGSHPERQTPILGPGNRGFGPGRPKGQGYRMSATRHAEIVIIGSGPAGYTAAVYAARAMRKPLLIAGIQPGGQLTITTDVENYPGFAETIQGPWLMEQMRAQALHVGTEIVEDTIVSVDLSKRPFTLKGDGGQI